MLYSFSKSKEMSSDVLSFFLTKSSKPKDIQFANVRKERKAANPHIGGNM